MIFSNRSGGLLPSAEERRLDQINDLIARSEEFEKARAAREAEEARQRALQEAQRPALSIEHLRAERARLLAVIADRDHHLKLDEERTMLDQRIESLQADVVMLTNTLNATSGELDAARDLRQRMG
jgi:hypothetical protein